MVPHRVRRAKRGQASLRVLAMFCQEAADQGVQQCVLLGAQRAALAQNLSERYRFVVDPTIERSDERVSVDEIVL
jgi:hypothetical protein